MDIFSFQPAVNTSGSSRLKILQFLTPADSQRLGILFHVTPSGGGYYIHNSGIRMETFLQILTNLNLLNLLRSFTGRKSDTTVCQHMNELQLQCIIWCCVSVWQTRKWGGKTVDVETGYFNFRSSPSLCLL